MKFQHYGSKTNRARDPGFTVSKTFIPLLPTNFAGRENGKCHAIVNNVGAKRWSNISSED
jgi:hypothetical protein